MLAGISRGGLSMQRFCLHPLLLLAALPVAAPPALAAKAYDNCTGFVTTVPVTLSSQGTWCMRADLATSITSGAAITLGNHNITLDCNDFKLGGLGGGASTQALGISATNRNNITVRNCNVRGFYRGIYIVGTSPTTTGGHVIEDNRVDNSTRTGMRIDGDGSMVQRNFVRDTGGSALGAAFGINTLGDVDVRDNTVTGVVPGADGSGNGTGNGMRVELNDGGVVQGNRVRGVTSVGTGDAFGIFVASGTRLNVRDNHVAGPGDTALVCPDSSSGAKDNSFFGFASGFTGCSNDGGNVVK
jgi:hypothetical protein